MKKTRSLFRINTQNARYKRYPKSISPAGIVQPNGQVIESTYPSIKEFNEYIWQHTNSFSLSLLIIGFATLAGIFVYRTYLILVSNNFTFPILFDSIFQTEFPNIMIVYCALSGGIISSRVFFKLPIHKQDKYLIRITSGITILCIINAVCFNMVGIKINGTVELYLPPELLTAQISTFLITALFTNLYRKKSPSSSCKFHLNPSVLEIIDLIRHLMCSVLILLVINWITHKLYPYLPNSYGSFSTIFSVLEDHLLELSLFITGAAFMVLFYFRVRRHDIVTTPNFLVRLFLVIICILIAVYINRQISTNKPYWIAHIINVMLVIIFIPIQRQLSILFVGNNHKWK